jgi:hypothetical protein
MARDVFISFASEDRPVATEICARLEKAGLRCFIAHRDIPVGAEWTEALLKGIDECEQFLLVFTSRANRSPHVKREAEHALSAKKRMLSFRLESAPLSAALQYCVGGSQWLDADYQPGDESLKKLSDTLLALRRPALRRRVLGWAGALLLLLGGVGAWSLYHPSAAPEERVLAYSLRAQIGRDGKTQEVTIAQPAEVIFHAGDKVRLRFVSPQAGYLYVLNEGPESAPGRPDYNILFPTPTVNRGSPALAASQSILVPGEGWFQFDEQTGAERIWLVWSAQKVPELESVRGFANPADGGSLKDPGKAAAVRQLLQVPAGDAVRSSPAGEGEIVLRARRSTLVHRLELSHRGGQ